MTPSNSRPRIGSFFFATLLSGIASAPLGCAAELEPDVGLDEAAVIQGERDTAHPAVVALSITRADGQSTCTGTIVKVDPATTVGHVLTAAHCIKDARSVRVTQADDRASADRIRFAVLDFESHPEFTGESPGSSNYDHDIGMIRILGVGATTPVMPMLAPEPLTPGARVTSVGFGRTTVVGEDPERPNTVKNRIDGTVLRVGRARFAVRYDGGNICKGDSGGPVVATVDGEKFVVGVHSTTDSQCARGVGVSVRPSSAMAFLAPILDAPAPPASCGVCRASVSSGEQACGALERACSTHADCVRFGACVSRCAEGDEACVRTCEARFPDGQARREAWLGCRDEACATECAP